MLESETICTGCILGKDVDGYWSDKEELLSEVSLVLLVFKCYLHTGSQDLVGPEEQILKYPK